MIECFLINNYSVNVMAPFCSELLKRGIECKMALSELFWRVSYGEHFNIEKAKIDAQEWGIELSLKPNYNIPIAVTQWRADWGVYGLYKNLKGRISYNVMLHKDVIFACNDYRFDYYFVYGNCEEDILIKQGVCKDRIVKIGAPKLKYESLRSMGIKKKKILTYFPTWDEYNMIDLAIEKLLSLKEKYEIYVKPHPLQSKRDLEKLKQFFILDPNINIKSAVYWSDVCAVDLKSGALMDIVYFNPQIPIIAFSKEKNLKDYFELYKYFNVVTEKDEIVIKYQDFNFLKKKCFVEEWNIKQVHKVSPTVDKDEVSILKERLEKSYNEYYGT